MKNLLLFFTVLIPVFGFSQIPDYFADDPKWVGGSFDYTGIVPYSTTHVYYLEGEETIESESYQVVWKSGLTFVEGPEPVDTFNIDTGFRIRQEGRNIYNHTGEFGGEVLLVSYDYAVGDTVRGDIFEQCGYQDETIQSIDSVLINTEYRKVFYLDALNGPILIEGVGHLMDLSGSIGDFLGPLCIGLGFESQLNCFGFGQTPYWSSDTNVGSCSLTVVGIDETNNIELKMYPNPATNEVFIDANEPIVSARMMTLSGQHLESFNGNSVDVRSFPAGMYIMEIILQNAQITRRRLIVE